MKDMLLHTPVGVRDIYDVECKKKLKVLNRIHHVLELYSYHDIETPTFEFFNIFNMDKGSASSSEMYKMFDRNNNTLVLRPDFTPSIARCAAKYYENEELPIRLCYSGNTFTNAHLHKGKLNESYQIGCELINDDSSAADAEIIACVISCLLETGLKEFQIEIGDVDFFKGLIEEAGIDEETANKIRGYISIKNFFGLQKYVEGLNISDNIKKAISNFDILFGGVEMLEEAKNLVNNQRSIEAINRMNKVYQALSYYGFENYVGFDLSMLNRYNYYTGIVFRGYTYGTGDAIVKGGRYNNLLSQFGKEAPSVGFAIFIDELMLVISRQKIEVEVDYSNMLILYDVENQQSAIALATKLRLDSNKIELIRKSQKFTLEDYIKYGKREHLSGIYYFENDKDIVAISLVDDSTNKVTLDELV